MGGKCLHALSRLRPLAVSRGRSLYKKPFVPRCPATQQGFLIGLEFLTLSWRGPFPSLRLLTPPCLRLLPLSPPLTPPWFCAGTLGIKEASASFSGSFIHSLCDLGKSHLPSRGMVATANRPFRLRMLLTLSKCTRAFSERRRSPALSRRRV